MGWILRGGGMCLVLSKPFSRFSPFQVAEREMGGGS